MTDIRTAILRGRAQATRVHRKFGMRARIEAEGGRIDVFDTIARSGLPLMFRPLDNLLGVYVNEPDPGIMVTTKRPLSIQRFTGAHELGHFVSGHLPSLDDESMLCRMPFQAECNEKQQEFEADAFATEFMLPPWLFAAHFERQGWTAAKMSDPATVYQLSLRIGASYEATCRSLMRPGVGVIRRNNLDSLLGVQPKQIKQMLLKDYEPPDWWRDVWLLTEKDEGTVIQGSRSDLFVLRLAEHSGSGYVWTFDELNETGFAIVRNERVGPSGNTVGGHTTRFITTSSESAQRGRMALAEKRPWVADGIPLSEFYVDYDLYGPEVKGLSKAERCFLLDAA